MNRWQGLVWTVCPDRSRAATDTAVARWPGAASPAGDCNRGAKPRLELLPVALREHPRKFLGHDGHSREDQVRLRGERPHQAVQVRVRLDVVRRGDAARGATAASLVGPAVWLGSMPVSP